MKKSLTMENAVSVILQEEANNGTVGNLTPGKPLFGSTPCPKATKNKVKIPPNFKGSPYDSIVERQYYQKGKKYKKCCPEEDEEVMNELPNEDIKEIILNQFQGLAPQTSGLALRDLLGYFQVLPGNYSKTQIMRVLQQLINSKEVRIDEMSKKMFLNSPEEDEEDVDYFINDDDNESYESYEDTDEENGTELEDIISDYFQNSTAGSVSGISLNQAIRDIQELSSSDKPSIMDTLKALLANNVLKQGITPGTIMFNSEIMDEPDLEEDSEEGVNGKLRSFILYYIQQIPEGTDIPIYQIVRDVWRFNKSYKYAVLEILQKLLAENIITIGNKKNTVMYKSNQYKEGKLQTFMKYYFQSHMPNVDILIRDAIMDIKKHFDKDDTIDTSNDILITLIKKLAHEKIIKRGSTSRMVQYRGEEEDEEVGVIPLIDKETPDTLKAKGWTETTPGNFVGPDGVQKYAITEDFHAKVLNTFMNYKDDAFEKLCEEFSADFDEMEGLTDDSDLDNTDGLDEFEDEDLDIEDEGLDDEVTITLSADEVDVLKKILAQVDGSEVTDDEMVDDLATDEEANIDLMGGEDEDFDDEDEEEDFDFNLEEDEETIADSKSSGVHDSTFSNGAPTLKKGTPSFGELRRKPFTGKGYNPTGGTAFDGTGRNGAPTMSKNTPTYDKSGKPVNVKQTKKAGSNDSIFNI